MKNVTMEVVGDELTIKVNLKQEFGKSKSGKTVVVGTTEGNPEIPGVPGYFAGVNVYKK